MPSDSLFVIWSLGHHAWRAPNCGGYTTRIEEARRYRPDEARTIVGDATVGDLEDVAIPLTCVTVAQEPSPVAALDPPDAESPDVENTARTQVLQRAQQGAPLSPADMCVIFGFTNSTYHRHAKRGGFDAFRVKGTPVGVHKYSGWLVWRYLQGEDPTRTFGATRGPRRVS